MTKLEEAYRVDGALGEPRRAFDPLDSGLQALLPAGLFDSRALFSQVIVAPHGRTVWISGLIGCTSENVMVSGGKAAQIAQAFRNLAAAMAAAGCEPSHCVRVTEYVVDYSMSDLPELRYQIAALFPAGRLPANTLVPVTRLGRDGALFEIDACCVLPCE